jgi:hypothetical protein
MQNISNDDLHTSIDKNTNITGSFTYTSAKGFDTNWLRKCSLYIKNYSTIKKEKYQDGRNQIKSWAAWPYEVCKNKFAGKNYFY